MMTHVSLLKMMKKGKSYNDSNFLILRCQLSYFIMLDVNMTGRCTKATNRMNALNHHSGNYAFSSRSPGTWNPTSYL